MNKYEKIKYDIAVSVIMPSFNVGKYIEQCLCSVMRQSLENIEILCIDANSEDGTLEIIKQYAARDPRINIVLSDVKSYGYQMNLGLKMARGKYISIVETDDYIESNMLEKLYHLAEENDLEIVKGDFCFFYGEKNNEINERCANYSKSFYYNKVVNTKLYPIICADDHNHWRGLYLNQFIKNNNICFNETPGAANQDVGFLIQTFICAKRMYYIDDVLYHYRYDRLDASSKNVDEIINIYSEFNWILYAGKFKSLFDSNAFYVIYLKMVVTFLGAFTRLVMANDSMIPDKYSTYISWFDKEINNFIARDNKVLLLLPEKLRFDLELYMYDKTLYIYKLKIDTFSNEYMKNLATDAEKYILFGYGQRGKRLFKMLDQNAVCAICDNSACLWGSNVDGIPVISLEDAIEQYEYATFIVANKNSREEIYQQLIDAGIDETRIVFYEL